MCHRSMTALLLSPPCVVALLPRHCTPQHRRAVRCVAMASSQPHVAVDQLPHTITSHYLAVQNPQQYQKTYTSAVKAFVRAAVLAYECGYSEDTLRRHLLQQQCQGIDDGLSEDEPTLDADTALCMRFITLVWVTCKLSPVGVRRWCAGALWQRHHHMQHHHHHASSGIIRHDHHHHASSLCIMQPWQQ